MPVPVSPPPYALTSRPHQRILDEYAQLGAAAEAVRPSIELPASNETRPKFGAGSIWRGYHRAPERGNDSGGDNGLARVPGASVVRLDCRVAPERAI